MGGEGECAKEEEVKGGKDGGQKNRWKVGQRGSRHSVYQSVSRGGGGWWWGGGYTDSDDARMAERKSESMPM